MAETIFIIKVVLASIMTLCAGFIIFVVLKQSGNSDGMEAMSGGGSSDQDSFYGRNAGARKEHKLKVWTYICAGSMALCSIAFVVLSAILRSI